MKYFTVTAAYAANLPGIAAMVYRDAQRWDVLFKANDLVDPLTLPAGTVLKIPPLDKKTTPSNGLHAWPSK